MLNNSTGFFRVLTASKLLFPIDLLHRRYNSIHSTCDSATTVLIFLTTTQHMFVSLQQVLSMYSVSVHVRSGKHSSWELFNSVMCSASPSLQTWPDHSQPHVVLVICVTFHPHEDSYSTSVISRCDVWQQNYCDQCIINLV